MSAQTQQHTAPSYQQSPAYQQAPAPLEELHGGFSVLRGWVGLALAALLALGVAIVAVALFTGDGSSSNQNAFTISYPKTWTRLPKAKLASLPGHPGAVLRRNNGQGLVVIRRQP